MSRFYELNQPVYTTDTTDQEPTLSKHFEDYVGPKHQANELITIRYKENLKNFISKQREYVNGFLVKSEKKVEDVTQKQQTYEKKLLNTYVDPIIDASKTEKDDLLTGLMAITTGTLAGLILNKQIKSLRYVKPLMPLSLGLLAFYVYIPNTFSSFTKVSYLIEGNIVGEGFLRKQDQLVQYTSNTLKSTVNSYHTIVGCVENAYTKTETNVKKVLSFFK
ncbi:uncharacterized protein HGUI_00750 [Hanseniaspora guilliermondii]|uniref:MICOS complex subunit n=1 Tax=Hanseniaspora guilliermondii TaxID=56406 RepID=A0A1L0FG39_9ASCO|nr:uncharacterized protein HGUI_00750 [Hanseniaspora guilliermondii]